MSTEEVKATIQNAKNVDVDPSAFDTALKIAYEKT